MKASEVAQLILKAVEQHGDFELIVVDDSNEGAYPFPVTGELTFEVIDTLDDEIMTTSNGGVWDIPTDTLEGISEGDSVFILS